MAMVDEYVVTCVVASVVQERRVSITEGYTTFGDIPKIISVATGVPIEHIFIQSAVWDQEAAKRYAATMHADEATAEQLWG